MLQQLITLYRDMGETLMSQVGGALTGGAAGLAGSIMGIPGQAISNMMQLGQQQSMSDMQEKENEKFASYAEGLQKDMWNYTNYENQVAHLNAAGLNPALLYAKGGPGGTTGQVSAPAGMGIAPNADLAHNAQAQQQLNLQTQETQADINVKNAQAHALETQANKTAGVDTQKTQAEIDNVKQLTQNAQVQHSINEWEAGIKSAEATVATQTIDANIKTITTAYEKLIQEVRNTTTAADVSQATKDQIIQQSRNATILQGLDMVLTRAQTQGIITNIAETKNAIQMAIQKNMREWDTMPNMTDQIKQTKLENDLKLDAQVPNAGKEILDAISHLVIPIYNKMPLARNPIGFGK